MTIKANSLDCKYTLWGAVTLKSPITMMYRCLSHHTNPTKGPLYSSESSLELPSSSAVLVDVLFFMSASHSASAFRHPTGVPDCTNRGHVKAVNTATESYRFRVSKVRRGRTSQRHRGETSRGEAWQERFREISQHQRHNGRGKWSANLLRMHEALGNQPWRPRHGMHRLQMGRKLDTC